VFKFSDTDTTLPAAAAFDTALQNVESIYAFAVKSGRIYVGDGHFDAAGKVYVYAAGIISVENIPVGTLQASFTVGVGPAGFYFNF
jgi:hypothetical protein